MPYVMELRLLPLDNNPLPTTLGYNSYALFLNILRDSCPEFATQLHKVDGPKPFTTAITSFGYQRKMSSASETSNELILCLTFLTDEAVAYFLKSALEWDSRALQLGSAHFKVEQVHLLDVGEPHKNFCSYEELLSTAKAERNIALQFFSPTAFRSEGKRNVLLPEPRLVFGSLFNRWNAFSPVKLSNELQLCFESQIILARYKLETRMLNFGSYQEVGFVGKCNFILQDGLSEQQLKAINALADFAFYSGIGAKTAMGMGQARRAKIGGTLFNKTGRKGANPRKGIETSLKPLSSPALNESRKGTNPRKGIETQTLQTKDNLDYAGWKGANPRKGIETLGSAAVW